MRLIALAVVVALSLPFAPLATGAQQPGSADSRPYKPEELEQIVTPIAQYPDALLSQIFMASTYPLEVIQAARFAKANPSRVDAEAQRCLPLAAKGYEGRQSAATVRVVLVLLWQCWGLLSDGTLVPRAVDQGPTAFAVDA